MENRIKELLNQYQVRIIFPHVPTVQITEEMKIEAERLANEIRLKAKEKGYKEVFTSELQDRIVGWLGHFAFFQYRHDNWKEALNYIPIGQPDKYDYKINDTTINLKTSHPQYVVDYTEGFAFQIPIQQAKKHDVFVDIIIWEDKAHIMGFATKEEVINAKERTNIKNPAKTIPRHKLHPIQDLFQKPIRTDRTIQDILPETEYKRLKELLSSMMTIPQLKVLVAE